MAGFIFNEYVNVFKRNEDYIADGDQNIGVALIKSCPFNSTYKSLDSIKDYISKDYNITIPEIYGIKSLEGVQVDYNEIGVDANVLIKALSTIFEGETWFSACGCVIFRNSDGSKVVEGEYPSGQTDLVSYYDFGEQIVTSGSPFKIIWKGASEFDPESKGTVIIYTPELTDIYESLKNQGQVKTTSADEHPGYLMDKIEAGEGIEISNVDEKVVITSTKEDFITSVSDTESLSLSAISGDLSGHVKISSTSGNILSLEEDGLYVPDTVIPEDYITSAANTNSIDLMVEDGTLYGNVNISVSADNILVSGEDGLFVPKTEIPEDYITSVSDTSTLTLSATSGNLNGEVKISDTQGNILSADDNGLYVPNTVVPEDYITSVGDTNSISLEVTSGELTGEIKISETSGNVLSLEEDGLYVGTDMPYFTSADEGKILTPNSSGDLEWKVLTGIHAPYAEIEATQGSMLTLEGSRFVSAHAGQNMYVSAEQNLYVKAGNQVTTSASHQIDRTAAYIVDKVSNSYTLITGPNSGLTYNAGQLSVVGYGLVINESTGISETTSGNILVKAGSREDHSAMFFSAGATASQNQGTIYSADPGHAEIVSKSPVTSGTLVVANGSVVNKVENSSANSQIVIDSNNISILSSSANTSYSAYINENPTSLSYGIEGASSPLTMTLSGTSAVSSITGRAKNISLLSVVGPNDSGSATFDAGTIQGSTTLTGSSISLIGAPNGTIAINSNGTYITDPTHPLFVTTSGININSNGSAIINAAYNNEDSHYDSSLRLEPAGATLSSYNYARLYNNESESKITVWGSGVIGLEANNNIDIKTLEGDDILIEAGSDAGTATIRACAEDNDGNIVYTSLSLDGHDGAILSSKEKIEIDAQGGSNHAILKSTSDNGQGGTYTVGLDVFQGGATLSSNAGPIDISSVQAPIRINTSGPEITIKNTGDANNYSQVTQNVTNIQSLLVTKDNSNNTTSTLFAINQSGLSSTTQYYTAPGSAYPERYEVKISNNPVQIENYVKNMTTNETRTVRLHQFTGLTIDNADIRILNYNRVYDPANNYDFLLRDRNSGYIDGLHTSEVLDIISPITSAGDLIVGGTSGSPEVLPMGSRGQVLTVGTSGLEWATGGEVLPITSAGDLIVGDENGDPSTLSIGTSGQVLTVNSSGAPEWLNPTGGAVQSVSSTDSISLSLDQNGNLTADINVDNTSGNVSFTVGSDGLYGEVEFPVSDINSGSAGISVSSDANNEYTVGLVISDKADNILEEINDGNNDGLYVPPSSLDGIITTSGDLIIGNSSGEPEALSIGSSGQVLMVNTSGMPSWGNAGGTDWYCGSFSTANRPANPTEGQYGYDTTIDCVIYYIDGYWKNSAGAIV